MCVVLSSCGRVGPPVAPETRSPAAVNNLLVQGSNSGIKFTWDAPDKDQQGKELKSIEGYRIERKEISSLRDLSDRKIRFEQVGYIADTHLQVLDKKREEARAQGKVGRKVTVDSSLKKFEFTDTTVKAGQTYVYRLLPENQGGTHGEITGVVHVKYQGQGSQVTILKDLP
jgi:hypothetical protein